MLVFSKEFKHNLWPGYIKFLAYTRLDKQQKWKWVNKDNNLHTFQSGLDSEQMRQITLGSNILRPHLKLQINRKF